MINDSEENEDKPRLNRMLYRAHEHDKACNDDTANELWDRAKRRVKMRRTFHDVVEVQFKEDGYYLPLHRAIQHGAPYHLIKELVDEYTAGCSVLCHDEMPLQTACGYPRHVWRQVQDLRYDTEWEEVILLLMQKNPAAIDTNKSTALHVLLEYNPSLALVEKMIDIHFSNNNTNVSLLEMRDEQNQLPLHVAVERVVSTDVVLKILQSYPVAATCTRAHDGALPLHCAVLFGCSGNVLARIIIAFPDALLHTENSENTPLHILFHMEKNTDRWNIGDKSDNSDGNTTLSETAICQLLLEYIPEEKMISTLKKKNISGHTVVEAATECAKVFAVPDDLIKLLVKAESGMLMTRCDVDLTVRNPFDLSTDEGSYCSESSDSEGED